ncbi:hypothetical protein F383_25024 [Gossypium arboreum]|uniref:Uncharacterized protein n=1 Tax=Gossypium arboreum TaxID=29729 RepID=A0A0B0P5V5_GOSAR|nr:hypothetical protein F383_25024 [Gossypium arboreum]
MRRLSKSFTVWALSALKSDGWRPL